MKTKLWLTVLLLAACDEPKADVPKVVEAAAPIVTAAPPSATASVAAPPIKKRLASECPAAGVDFGGDAALEAAVRKKTKATGPLSRADLASIKSLNLVSEKAQALDPCVFPLLTSLKDLFLGPGDYDDLSPLAKLGTLESLRVSASRVKELKPLEGLKKLDRLDLSHTLVTDADLAPVGTLVNLTELMLDETQISDLAPLSNLKKLEKLSLKKTQVKSLAPLATLTRLKILYVEGAPVTNIEPVQPLMRSGLKLITN